MTSNALRSSGRVPHVAVVQPACLAELERLAHLRRLRFAVLRRVAVERHVAASPVVAGKVRGQDAPPRRPRNLASQGCPFASPDVDDDLPAGMPFQDVAHGVGNAAQGIATIDHGLQLPLSFATTPRLQATGTRTIRARRQRSWCFGRVGVRSKASSSLRIGWPTVSSDRV